MKFIITWEVSWSDEDWNQIKRYTDTHEDFSDDEIESVDDFIDKFEEMFLEDRFSPEHGVNEFLEVGGDVNIEYVKICDMDGKELWRDPEYKEDT